MSSRKIIDIANSLEFIRDYNINGISGNNARISTSDTGELVLYSNTISTNSTTGTVVLYNGGLSINSTQNSNSYTSGGALTIAGGASIAKDTRIGLDLYVSNSIIASGLTIGNINFTGNIYKNGELYISSQWLSGTGGNLIYNTGNVGIGTTSPNYLLDVNGNIRATNILATNITSTNINTNGITAGNINFTGNLYQNGSLYTSSQWSNIGGNLIYDGGNIGIGTTSPTAKCDITGNLNVLGSSSISSISSSRNGDVLSIQNISVNGNSSIEFQSTSGSSKLHIGYANASSSLTNFAGTSYILSDGSTSIKIAAGNKTSIPVIINASDNSVSITTTTDATDIYSGSLKVSGGVGIANKLYVGDDAYINRDLYVYGTINGAAASSSSFSYMTLTGTDDSINLSTGTLITFGGITIQSTANAKSLSNGGSLLTDGGAAIGKTLYVGEKIITDFVSTSNLISYNVTCGDLLLSSVNFGVSSIYSGSFVPINNNVTPSNVVGLQFDNSFIRSFTITLCVNIIATANLYETFVIEGIQSDTNWDLYTSCYGNTTNVTFSITSSGQIQYTTPDFAGFSNAIFRYQVVQISKTGTYVYPGMNNTQATLLTNTIQILNTEDSNIGTHNGGLYLAGGCTIDKTLCSNTVSTSNLRTTIASIGTLLITNNLSVAGTITNDINLIGHGYFGNPTTGSARINIKDVNTQLIEFQSSTNSIGNIQSFIGGNPGLIFNSGRTNQFVLTSNGNVGIGTTLPVAPLHITGTTSITSSTVGGIFMGAHTNNYTFLQLNSSSGSYINFANVGNDFKGRILYDSVNNSIDFYTNSTVCSRIDSTGSLTMTGDITAFGNISDGRLKEHIVPIDSENALDIINALSPVKFNWKQDIFNVKMRGEEDIGFIAQDVETIIPYAVSEFSEIITGETYKRMKHERIIPYLVSAIQKLDAQNFQHLLEIQKLTQTIDLLVERITNLEYNSRNYQNHF